MPISDKLHNIILPEPHLFVLHSCLWKRQYDCYNTLFISIHDDRRPPADIDIWPVAKHHPISNVYVLDCRVMHASVCPHLYSFYSFARKPSEVFYFLVSAFFRISEVVVHVPISDKSQIILLSQPCTFCTFVWCTRQYDRINVLFTPYLKSFMLRGAPRFWAPLSSKTDGCDETNCAPQYCPEKAESLYFCFSLPRVRVCGWQQKKKRRNKTH